MWASRWNLKEMVKLLLKHNADVKIQSLHEGDTASTLASRFGHTAVAALLLSLVTPEIRDVLVNLASRIVSICSDVYLGSEIRLMIDVGTLPLLQEDKTPLDYASDNCREDVIELLVSMGGLRNKGRPQPEVKSETHKKDLMKTVGPFLSEKSRKLELKQRKRLSKTTTS